MHCMACSLRAHSPQFSALFEPSAAPLYLSVLGLHHACCQIATGRHCSALQRRARHSCHAFHEITMTPPARNPYRP